MRKTLLTAAALVSWVFVAAGEGQAPNFSGAWSATKDVPPGAAAAPSPVFGARFWIAHQPNSVVVTRPVRDTASVATHAADGSESRTRVPGATCMGDSIVTTTVTVAGTELVHTLVSQVTPGASAPAARGLKHTFRLLAPDTLEVETTTTSTQGVVSKVATIYKKGNDSPPALSTPPVKVAPASLAQMGWLSGNWAGTSGTTATEERWTAATGGAMHAVSRTMRGPSLTAFEFLCIAEQHGGLVYTAMPNARTPATDFFLTAIDATSATFENPLHDFPKTIRYVLKPDGALDAIVSGEAGSRSTTFTFRKQN
ncbi:MAG TPA: DUF6265 family protein [Vicinamibacterales bacterium]|nr:DUF6265 family protein [Vicinamibacterales bacterium]